MRDAAGEFDHFESTLDVAAANRRSTLPCSEESRLRKLVHVLLDERLEGEQHPRAALRIDADHSGNAFSAASTARRSSARMASGARALHLARRRIEHIAPASRRSRDGAAGDEMGQIRHENLSSAANAPGDARRCLSKALRGGNARIGRATREGRTNIGAALWASIGMTRTQRPSTTLPSSVKRVPAQDWPPQRAVSGNRQHKSRREDHFGAGVFVSQSVNETTQYCTRSAPALWRQF